MNNYAVISGETVTNVIIWNGTSEWTPPDGTTLVMVDEGWGFGVGDLYIDGVFYRPVTPDPEVDADGYMTQNGVRMTDANGQWITAEVYYA